MGEGSVAMSMLIRSQLIEDAIYRALPNDLLEYEEFSFEVIADTLDDGTEAL